MAALRTGLKVPLSRVDVTRCIAAELAVDDGIVIGGRWSALLKTRAGMAEELKAQAW